jgi:hypothetical protein
VCWEFASWAKLFAIALRQGAAIMP